jgi:hypothetical protein
LGAPELHLPDLRAALLAKGRTQPRPLGLGGAGGAGRALGVLVGVGLEGAVRVQRACRSRPRPDLPLGKHRHADDAHLACIAHARRVASEGTLGDAEEALLAGLAGAPAAERGGVAVGDPRRFERLVQRRLVELRVPPGGGEAPDVDERLHTGLHQAGDELLRRPRAVADREDRAVLRHPGAR